MRIVVAAIIISLSACAPDGADIDCNEINCEAIAADMCKAGYVMLCKDLNAEAVWCLYQLHWNKINLFMTKTKERCSDYIHEDLIPETE